MNKELKKECLIALIKAKETINIWHGDIAWEIYNKNSPEMKTINECIDRLQTIEEPKEKYNAFVCPESGKFTSTADIDIKQDKWIEELMYNKFLGAGVFGAVYKLENGNYMNRCIKCKELFLGHKRRLLCKECFKLPYLITKL